MDDDNKDNSTNDDALWHYVTRSIKPIHREKRLFPDEKTEKIPPRRRHNHPPALPPEKAEQLQQWIDNRGIQDIPDHAPPPALNRRTEQKLRQGKMPIDGTLDLHGLTQDEAYSALVYRLTRAQAEEKRCILVITGKGRSTKSEGVLRRRVPEWLTMPPLRAIVLRGVPARPQHGGTGALYVLLKRQRKQD